MQHRTSGIWKSTMSTHADIYHCINIELIIASVSLFGLTFGVDRLLSELNFLSCSLLLATNLLMCAKIMISAMVRLFGVHLFREQCMMLNFNCVDLLLLLDGYFSAPNREDVHILTMDNKGVFPAKSSMV